MAKRVPKKKRPVWTRLYIAEWIEALDLKATTVAERAGVSESHLSLLSAGKRAYTQPMLEKLAKVMGITAGHFFHRPGDPSLLAAMERLSDDDRARAAKMIEAPGWRASGGQIARVSLPTANLLLPPFFAYGKDCLGRFGPAGAAA